MLSASTIKASRRLGESVRVLAPEIGIVDDGMLERIESLLAREGVRVAYVPIPDPSLYIAEEQGRGTLFVCSGCSEHQRVYLLARGLGLVWPSRVHDPDAADLFGVHVALPYAVRHAGERAQVERVRELAARPGLFLGKPLAVLLEAVDVLNRRLDPQPHATPDAVCTRARDLLDQGKLARGGKHFEHAMECHREAERTAREAGDHEASTRALIGLACTARSRGAYPEACRFARRAIARARRHDLRDALAEALHEGMVVATEMGHEARALEFSRDALWHYRDEHPRFPVFLHDRAYLWMARGYFGMALPLLKSAVPLISDASELLSVWGNIARASGAVGDSRGYGAAALAVDQIRALPGQAECSAADALIEVAHGAASLGRWAHADHVAREALVAAVRSRERRLEAVAGALIESIEKERAALAARPVTPPKRDATVAVEMLRRARAARVARRTGRIAGGG